MLIVTGHMYVDHLELAQFLPDLEVLAAAMRHRRGNIAYDLAVADPLAGRLLVRSVGQINPRSALTSMPSTPWHSSADGKVGYAETFSTTMS
ncbi:antibiotic biosynthesis monooxygenase [Rhizobium sp. Leaf371]|uniref:antibiotic biosynthesis monooxygenase n=1 Tax=Rhizobium sp. Leaf371 TaxID=1736355 RepID=UPI001FCCC52E|nr:antibiotic biosynthesis monooxygenase [Rhizobium sp. Leaf371]